MRHDERSRCNRLHSGLLVGYGVIVALLLHYYLLSVHDIPNAKARAQGVRQSQGSVIAPIVKDRALWLLLLGLFPPVVMRKTPWCAALAYALGIAASFSALTLAPPLSNLWPITLVIIIALTAIPAFAGASITALALTMYQGRRNVDV